MFKCIANDENQFLILDTKDGVCEWTVIQSCRKFLEMGITIEGLTLRSIDKCHKYLDYSPVTDFIPASIVNEIKHNCTTPTEYIRISNVVKAYILNGNNIIKLRGSSSSFKNFIQNLVRWCSSNG